MTKALATLGAAAITLAVASPCAAQSAPSPDPDPWFGVDKSLHFAGGALLAGGGYAIGVAAFEERWVGLLFGAGFGLVAGAAKEGLDAAGLGTPSYKDFIWTALGTALGLGVSITFDAALRGPVD